MKPEFPSRPGPALGASSVRERLNELLDEERGH